MEHICNRNCQAGMESSSPQLIQSTLERIGKDAGQLLLLWKHYGQAFEAKRNDSECPCHRCKLVVAFGGSHALAIGVSLLLPYRA